MRSGKLAALAAIAMMGASSVAAAQSSAPGVSAPAVRAAEPAEDANALVGTTAWILAAIALGLIIWGIIELTDDSSSP